MKATARRDGAGGYVLNGSKTFITNGPYADTIVFICKLDDGETAPERRKIVKALSAAPSVTFKEVSVPCTSCNEFIPFAFGWADLLFGD